MDSVYFRSSFWRDPFTRTLTSNNKLLYIYLLTNREIQPSGIYEFLEDDCFYQTGITRQQIRKGLVLLSNKEKILYADGWVFIVNFLRKSFNLPKKVVNEKVRTNISNQLLLKNIPKPIIACFYSQYHSLSINYPYTTDIIKSLGFSFKLLDFSFKSVDKGDGEIEYTPEFEECRKAYPLHKNDNKPEAYEKYQSTLKKGATSKELLTAVQNYTLTRRGEDKKYNKHMKTFFGHNEHWKDFLNKPKPINDGTAPYRPEKERERVKGTPEAENLWEQVKAKIEKQVKPESFETWFDPTVGYTLKGNTLEVAVSQQVFANFIKDYYAKIIKEALPGREVEFVVVPGISQ